MTRSSRIIIIFVVITLILGIGCLFLIDFSGDAQNLQNAQKNTVTEVENDAPGNKKVEADSWLFRLSMKERKFGRWMLHAVRGHFPIILHM